MVNDAPEILLNALAGLGLFFVGVKMIGRNLSGLVSDQIRARIRRASQNTWLAAVFGTVTGFVTQSGRTTSFIMASFVQGGFIDVRHAVPVALWSNLGCTLIITAAVFPIHLFALFLLGVTGACIAFERPRPLQGAANAVFGLALMLFGLKMISASAGSLTGIGGFESLMGAVNASLINALLAGLVLTVMAQSHMSIILIVVTFANGGLLEFQPAVMAVLGAHLGSSVITWLTGVNFRGEPRQVVVAQMLYNVIGVLLMGLLLGLDWFIAGPHGLIQSLTEQLGASLGLQVAAVALALNLLTPAAIGAALPVILPMIQRWSPATRDEELSKPRYLHEEASESTAAMLMLAEREQLRLLRRLPEYLELARVADPGQAADLASRHAAFQSVHRAIEAFQARLAARNLSPELTEWLVRQQRREELLAGLEEVCRDLAGVSGDGSALAGMRSAMVESLDAMVLTAISGFEQEDREELDMLATMTEDRGPMMEAMRRRYLAGGVNLSDSQRIEVLRLTSLFERAVWCIRRFGAAAMLDRADAGGEEVLA
ncbi:MAG: Na/Pi symporter [Steroidobacteraceae bacterium]